MSESWIPRFGPRALVVVDGLVAVVVVVVTGLRTAYGAAPVGGPLVGWLLAVAVGAPLALRRWRPTAVFALVLVAAGAGIAAGAAGEVPLLAVAYALYLVVLHGSAARAAVAVAIALGVVSAAGVVSALGPVTGPADVESFSRTPVSALLYAWAVVLGCWVLARAVRARRDHAAQVAELVARRAVDSERLRIARDIHDVVGHNLSLITLRASVANHLADGGQAALTEIEAISRRALADVRAVLGAVRDPEDPRAATLEQLIADSRTAGLDVEYSAADLTVAPESVRISAYRIVQEALTNVVRHARTTRCRVRLAVEEEVVLVEVVDDGPARRPMGPPGHGLVGIRERAALHRGSAVAGPRPEGGFAVRARLPTRPEAVDG